MKPTTRILASAILVVLAPLAAAQTTTPTTTTTTSTANAGQTRVATSIAANFTNLAGGMDNSLALVNALRSGTPVTLTTTTPATDTAPATTTTDTFSVPTKPMGWAT